MDCHITNIVVKVLIKKVNPIRKYSTAMSTHKLIIFLISLSKINILSKVYLFITNVFPNLVVVESKMNPKLLLKLSPVFGTGRYWPCQALITWASHNTSVLLSNIVVLCVPLFRFSICYCDTLSNGNKFFFHLSLILSLLVVAFLTLVLFRS